MNNHELGLEILDTNNENILKIMDVSVYSTILPVVCPELLITAPGYQFSANIPQEKLTNGFNLTLTACDLEIQTSKCDSQLNKLPDGLYAIKYSVSPKEYVYTHINWFRTAKANNELHKIICGVKDCVQTRERKEKFDQIRDIQDLLYSAKNAAEFCHEPKRAKEYYDLAMKLMKKLDCKDCR